MLKYSQWKVSVSQYHSQLTAYLYEQMTYHGMSQGCVNKVLHVSGIITSYTTTISLQEENTVSHLEWAL